MYDSCVLVIALFIFTSTWFGLGIQPACDSPQYIELDMSGTLQCTFPEGFSTLLWYNSSDVETTYPIIHRVKGVVSGSGYDSGEFEINENGSLVIHNVKTVHEHDFAALYQLVERGPSVTIIVKAIVFAYPSPSHPVIPGFDNKESSFLRVETEGNLSCTLKGVRPKVKMEFRASNERDISAISFLCHQLTIEKLGETFGIVLVSSYELKNRVGEKINVECVTFGSNIELLDNRRSSVELYHSESLASVSHRSTITPVVSSVDAHHTEYQAYGTTIRPNNSGSSISPWIFLGIMLFVVLMQVVLTPLYIQRKLKGRKTRKEEGRSREETKRFIPAKSLDQINKETEVKFQILLREKYRRFHQQSRPSCFCNQYRNIDKIGLEYLQSSDQSWKPLTSYHDIFNNNKLKSKRRFIESKAGYGKSSLVRHLAAEWCNSNTTFNVELLIILHFKHLCRVNTIYKAIQNSLLPAESEDSIQRVLESSKSVLIIIDGFFAFPPTECDNSCKTIQIIIENINPKFEVIITSRSLNLPNNKRNYGRIRLTGVSKDNQINYIYSSLSFKIARQLESFLRENPAILDLCQSPMMLTTLVKIFSQKNQFRCHIPITQILQGMIDRFYQHPFDKDEFAHSLALGKAALEVLIGNKSCKSFSCKKGELYEKIGKEVLDHYLHIGILVEEEVLCENSQKIEFNGSVRNQRDKNVTFYHSILLEWFAAFYLSENNYCLMNENLSKLLQGKADLLKFEYMLRFLCGLSDEALKYMSDFVRGTPKDMVAFGILCSLESGKSCTKTRGIIRKFCLECVVISNIDSFIRQQSTWKLLEVATQCGVSIPYLSLHNCIESVDNDVGVILATNRIPISNCLPVKELVIALSNRDFNDDEPEDILKYASSFSTLELLRFRGCVLPRRIEPRSIPSELTKRNVKVRWKVYADSESYDLDLDGGLWKNSETGKELLLEDHCKIWQDLSEKRKEWTREKFKEWLKSFRDEKKQIASQQQQDID